MLALVRLRQLGGLLLPQFQKMRERGHPQALRV
jgi:hypothetical protein